MLRRVFLCALLVVEGVSLTAASPEDNALEPTGVIVPLTTVQDKDFVFHTTGTVIVDRNQVGGSIDEADSSDGGLLTLTTETEDSSPATPMRAAAATSGCGNGCGDKGRVISEGFAKVRSANH